MRNTVIYTSPQPSTTSLDDVLAELEDRLDRHFIGRAWTPEQANLMGQLIYFAQLKAQLLGFITHVPRFKVCVAGGSCYFELLDETVPNNTCNLRDLFVGNAD